MKLLALLLVLFLTGCANIPMYDDSCTAALAAISECREPAIEVKLPTHVQLKKIPPAKDKSREEDRRRRRREGQE